MDPSFSQNYSEFSLIWRMLNSDWLGHSDRQILNILVVVFERRIDPFFQKKE